MSRIDGRAPRAYPLQAPTSVMVKLGSIAVHAEEALSARGHEFDWITLEQLLADAEVQKWLKSMQQLALVPLKRR